MNILCIVSDQQRKDIMGCYGNGFVKTPNIDALAHEGVIFTNAFTPIPLCAPARASMLTGLRPLHHGITRNEESGSVDGRDFTCNISPYPEILKEKGYGCYHIGKWHVGTTIGPADCGLEGVHHKGYGFPNQHPDYLEYLDEKGFPPFQTSRELFGAFPSGENAGILSACLDQPPEATIPAYLANRTISAIHKAQAAGIPFCIRIDFWGPHEPYLIPEPYYSMYDNIDTYEWENFRETFEKKPCIQKNYLSYWGVQDFTWKEWQRLIRHCMAYTTLIDDQIGKLMAVLKELGIYDDTAVFYLSDHGGMVGGHRLCDKGPFAYEEILRIPLICRIPGITTAGSRNDAFVYNYDVMPTFIELAGLTVPEGLDAASLLPVIRGEGQREKVMFAEFYGHQVPYPQRIIRTERHKYIFNGPESDEFYDLEKDSAELNNEIENPAYESQLLESRKRLEQHLLDTGDLIYRYFKRTRLV